MRLARLHGRQQAILARLHQAVHVDDAVPGQAPVGRDAALGIDIILLPRSMVSVDRLATSTTRAGLMVSTSL